MEERSPDAGRKPVGNEEKHKKGLRTETSDSVREPDWVVGLQILTHDRSEQCTLGVADQGTCQLV